MADHEARYRQAAATYAVYGVIYWLGGLALAAAGLGPRGRSGGGVGWFVVGALFVVVIPWLLARERAWVDRWILSRRDLTRLLAVLVAVRAVEVARLARTPRAAGAETVPVLGLPVPIGLGAGAFCLVTAGTAVMLARAAWSRA